MKTLAQFESGLNLQATPTDDQETKLTAIRSGIVNAAKTIFKQLPEGPERSEILGQLRITWYHAFSCVTNPATTGTGTGTAAGAGK
jgi:hypothetical protein